MEPPTQATLVLCVINKVKGIYMQRRGFLKFALGGTVGLVASPAIWTTLYDLAYWTQNWGWIPRLQNGEDLSVATVSKLDGTPIKIRVNGGRVIRTSGNKDNEYSKGGLTPLAASEAQLLYCESRVKRPLKRGPDGGYTYISWEEAENILKEKTKNAQGSVAFLTADTSTSLNDVFSAFIKENGSQDFFFMPNDEAAANYAWQAMGGEGKIGYDIANSDCILSVGANFLDSWGPVARNRAVFNETHPTDGSEASQAIYYAGAMQNNTAVVADAWLPVKPGTEEIFLYGILGELAKNSLLIDPAISSLSNQYSLDAVSQTCGTSVKQLQDLVLALKNANRPLVLAGTTEGQSLGSSVHMLAIAINYVLGRINQDGGLISLPEQKPLLPSALPYAEAVRNNFVAFCQIIADGSLATPKLLFINEANPVYALSKNAKVQECLAKIDYTVSFATHWNETCAQSDLVLPAAHGLERFDDVCTPYGSGCINWTIAKPVTEPHYQARPVGELLIALADELGLDLGVSDIPSLLEMKANALGVDFQEYLESGATFVQAGGSILTPTISFMPLLTKLAKAPAAETALLAYVNAAAGNPSTGIPPYANRAITDYQLQQGLCVAQMNKATAQKLGLDNNQKAFIETQNGRMPVLVKLYEGIMPDVVAVMTGLGHTEFDRFSTNKGNNILEYTQIEMETGSDLPCWSSAVKVVKG